MSDFMTTTTTTLPPTTTTTTTTTTDNTSYGYLEDAEFFYPKPGSHSDIKELCRVCLFFLLVAVFLIIEIQCWIFIIFPNVWIFAS